MDYLDFLPIPSEVRVQPESPLSRMYTGFPTVRKFAVVDSRTGKTIGTIEQHPWMHTSYYVDVLGERDMFGHPLLVTGWASAISRAYAATL